MKVHVRCLIVLLALISIVSGCASNAVQDGGSAEQRYIFAKELIVRNALDESYQQLKNMAVFYPFHELTQKLQFDLAFAFNEHGRYEEVLVLSEQLIIRFPEHRDIGDAHYLKGLSLFNQLQDESKVSEGRDQARNVLASFVRRYPESKYVAQAKMHIEQLDKLGSPETLSLAKQRDGRKEIKSGLGSGGVKPRYSEIVEFEIGAIPSRGMRMAQVSQLWGVPEITATSPGDRPIIRWFYDGLVVYFENDYVIHALITE